MPHLLMINGPNLSRLGLRSPRIYGTMTLREIEEKVERLVTPQGWQVDPFQSNHEGEIIDFLEKRHSADALILNPGALMINGWALRDALEDFPAPWVEIHISNVWSREAFRHNSILSPLASGFIAGLGWHGYLAAASWLIDGPARSISEGGRER